MPGNKRPPVLVQGDGEHAVGVVESGLDAVAVVDIDIDVGDAQPLIDQPLDGDGGVVEDAEAEGGGFRRVVHPAAETEGDVALVVEEHFRAGE